MECNKDEAERAKRIAEEKMKAGDFVVAQKLVEKAQRLYPDLENIVQMITICDVHSSANNKISGLDNWYAILEVQHFADAITIKKQYRKLALLLHPDKNKFAGAEAAFKLVGEAYRLLSDQIKRSQYDVRYRSYSALANRQSNANSGRRCAAANNTAETVATVTFWTCCKHCGHRYKYLREYMNNVMHCSYCQRYYIARVTASDGVPPNSSTAGEGVHDTYQPNIFASTGAEPRSSAAEMDKNWRVGRKLNKKNQENEKMVAGDRKHKKDEGCIDNDVEGVKPQKGETVTNNSAEIPKVDVLKPQPEVKESETGAVNSILDLSAPKKKQAAKKKRKSVEESSKSFGVDGSDVAGGKTDTNAVKGPEGAGKLIPDLSAPKKKQAANKKRKSVEESTKSFEVDGSDVAETKTDTNEVQKPEVGAGKSIPDLSAPKKKQAANKKSKSVEESTKSFEVDGSDVAEARIDTNEVKKPEAGAGKSIPDLSAPKKKQAAKKKRESVEESTKSSEVDGSDVAGVNTDTKVNSKRKSSRKKPQVYNAEGGSNGDFVSPPTKKTRSGGEIESDSNAKQMAEDKALPELAESSVSSASSHADKGKAKQNVNSGNEDISLAKNKVSESYEANGQDAALPSKIDKVENGNKANGNPNKLEKPDPEFYVFEDERKTDNFAVNQVWSICDSGDGMPRKYVEVKEVLDAEFKLLITYLEPVQDESDESIPVACGEFKNGETKEVTDRSVFSGQMIHSVSNGNVSIYPKKGEIWALFREWKEEWDTSLKKHKLPYKYVFAKVLSDFDEEDGVGVAYLGKLEGFVSLFQFEAQNRVFQIQFPTNELGRFCHKVPAVRMTGEEKESVPPGSYELDPAALPKYIFQDVAVDVEKESEILKGKADGPCPEAPDVEVKTTPVPETAPPSARKGRKSDEDNGICSSRSHESCSSQVDEKNTPKESRKNGEVADGFKRRKSPRLEQSVEKESGKQGNEMNAKKTDKGVVSDSSGISKSSKGEEEKSSKKKKEQRNGESRSLSKENDLATQLDGSTSTNKSPETSLVSSSSCKTPQRNVFDFKSLRSEDKFQVNQVWAIYSNYKGMPTEYVKIRKMDTMPKLKLHVTQMELFPPSAEHIATRPVSCGEFKLKPGRPIILAQTSFSHEVNAIEDAKKKNIVKVYPRKGEVWGVYKNCDSTKEEEHEIVEVVEEDGEIIKVVALTPKGSNSSLYTTLRLQGSNAGFIDIPKTEMSKRFSHQIPAFRHPTRTTRLVERGCWELDSTAIPGRTIVLD